MNATNVGSLAKYVLSMGLGDYVDEVLEYHAAKIDPCEISYPPSWYEALTVNVPQRYVLLKLNLSELVYDMSDVLANCRPTPDSARFIKQTELISLGQNDEKMQLVNTYLEKNRKQFEQVIHVATGGHGKVGGLGPDLPGHL